MDVIKPTNPTTEPNNTESFPGTPSTSPEVTSTSVTEDMATESPSVEPESTEPSFDASPTTEPEVPETPSEPVAPVTPSSQPVQEGEPEHDEPEAMVSAAPAASAAIKPKRGPMTAVMIIVILVILSLGVAAYFAFVKKDTPAINNSASKTPATSAATTVNTDTVSQSIDTSLNKLDDTKDYSTTDLADTTLGL